MPKDVVKSIQEELEPIVEEPVVKPDPPKPDTKEEIIPKVQEVQSETNSSKDDTADLKPVVEEPVKEVLVESIPEKSATTDKSLVGDKPKEMPKKTAVSKQNTSSAKPVKGKCKSGRFWKSDRDRFRSVIKSKGLKQSYQKRLKQREEVQRAKVR